MGGRDRPYPPPGALSTGGVQKRLGITYRQLTYLRGEIAGLRDADFNEKPRWREWPEEIVRRLEVAVAIGRVLPVAHQRHSQLPAIANAVLNHPAPPPEAGWVIFDGDGVRYAYTLRDLDAGHGGVLAPIPAPWSLGEGKPNQADRRWAVIIGGGGDE